MAKHGVKLVPDFRLLGMVSPLKVFYPLDIDAEFTMFLTRWLWLWGSHLIALCVCILVCVCVCVSLSLFFLTCKMSGMFLSCSSGLAKYLPRLEYNQKRLRSTHSSRTQRGDELLQGN